MGHRSDKNTHLKRKMSQQYLKWKIVDPFKQGGYPFGMLMPGRYVSDTSQHCVTVTRPTWVWKWVISNCHDVYGWVWYNYLKVGRGTATKVDDAILVDLPAATDGVSFDISVNLEYIMSLMKQAL